MKTKIAFPLLALLIILSSCATTADGPFIHQKFPIHLEMNNVATVQMNKLAGTHMVGIQCSSQIWTALTNSPQKLAIQLMSSDEKNAHLFGLRPGSPGTLCDYIPDTHYLFQITALGKAKVEITFPKLPPDGSDVEIIVCKTPEQTEW